MKILSLSDQVVETIHRPNLPDRFPDIDLIIGCGDLPSYYLEFVVSSLNVPLFYVPGNHDFDDFSVPGGEDVDGRILRHEGVWIAGLGGSQRYKAQGKHQYTEREMQYRVLLLLFRLFLKGRFPGKGVDLFITHSPPFGIHDGEDLAHVGFRIFHRFLQFTHPKFMLHGHSHAIRSLVDTKTEVLDTLVINVYPYRIVEFMENP
jgi:Icc-related predicted phosphoesterase